MVEGVGPIGWVGNDGTVSSRNESEELDSEWCFVELCGGLRHRDGLRRLVVRGRSW